MFQITWKAYSLALIILGRCVYSKEGALQIQRMEGLETGRQWTESGVCRGDHKSSWKLEERSLWAHRGWHAELVGRAVPLVMVWQERCVFDMEERFGPGLELSFCVYSSRGHLRFSEGRGPWGEPLGRDFYELLLGSLHLLPWASYSASDARPLRMNI